jgi:enoyl-CoA hydratase/carnithine racemase
MTDDIDQVTDSAGTVAVERRDNVLLATISNPPMALMDLAIVEQIGELAERADRDASVGAVVLTGAHPDRFVAHYDVAELLENARSSPRLRPRTARQALSVVASLRKLPGGDPLLQRSPAVGLWFIERFREVMRSIEDCAAVWVAAINGSAMGGGNELALACDLRIAADGDHALGQPEIMLGFPPVGGSTQRLVRMLGTTAALRIVLDGQPLTPREALEVGMVDHVVDAASLQTFAVEEAARLGSRPKAAIGAVKRAVYQGASLPLDRGLRLEASEFLGAVGTEEALDAMAAYVRATRELGDLPAYDRDTVAATVARGRFR